jgi:hypothetical protein
MSRPQKMHKPLKGGFTQIINAIADGKGVELQARNASRPKGNAAQSPKPLPPKKP